MKTPKTTTSLAFVSIVSIIIVLLAATVAAGPSSQHGTDNKVLPSSADGVAGKKSSQLPEKLREYDAVLIQQLGEWYW